MEFFFRDTAELYRSLLSAYCRNALGIFLVHNISICKTFENISGWLNDINDRCDTNTIKYLIRNEIDSSSNHEVTHHEAKEFADKQGLMFTETSSNVSI